MRRGPFDHLCPRECAFDAAALAAQRRGVSAREAAEVVNCSLMSDCVSRHECLEMAFRLIAMAPSEAA